jgi:hypothetical protein
MARLSIGRIWPFVLVALACCAGVIHGGDCYTGCRNARFWGPDFFGTSAIRFSPDICRTGGDCADYAEPVDCEFKQANVVQFYTARDCYPTCTGGTCGGLFRQFSCADYDTEYTMTDDYKCKKWLNPGGGS